MIEAKTLVKKYGTFTAVDGVNLSIPKRQIYGFLGPNGAGKTTTINMLLGVLTPTSGSVTLFEESFNPNDLELRSKIGVVPEKHPVGFWPWLTAWEYLAFFADLFAVNNPEPRMEELLARVELLGVRNKRIREFSRGMLQKLNIVRSLLHDPDILFLDEPISGLDPLGIKQVRDLIVDENRKGRTIFISSHILSEVEKICQRVAIISNGKIEIEEDMSRLLSTLGTEREFHIEVETIPGGLDDHLLDLSFVRGCDIRGNTLIIKVKKQGDFRKDLSQFLFSRDLVPLSIQENTLSLEDAFITITGENVGEFTSRKVDA